MTCSQILIHRNVIPVQAFVEQSSACVYLLCFISLVKSLSEALAQKQATSSLRSVVLFFGMRCANPNRKHFKSPELHWKYSWQIWQQIHVFVRLCVYKLRGVIENVHCCYLPMLLVAKLWTLIVSECLET